MYLLFIDKYPRVCNDLVGGGWGESAISNCSVYFDNQFHWFIKWAF